VSNDAIQKLVLFDFVMAAQASDFCFSSYKAFGISSEKKGVA